MVRRPRAGIKSSDYDGVGQDSPSDTKLENIRWIMALPRSLLLQGHFSHHKKMLAVIVAESRYGRKYTVTLLLLFFQQRCVLFPQPVPASLVPECSPLVV